VRDDLVLWARDTLLDLGHAADLALRTGLQPPRVSARGLRLLRAVATGEAGDLHGLSAATGETGEALIAAGAALAADPEAAEEAATAREAMAELFDAIEEDGATDRIAEAKEWLARTPALWGVGGEDAAAQYQRDVLALFDAIKEDGATPWIEEAKERVVEEFLWAGLTAEVREMLRDDRARADDA
jgi:hypothetical protein